MPLVVFGSFLLISCIRFDLILLFIFITLKRGNSFLIFSCGFTALSLFSSVWPEVKWNWRTCSLHQLDLTLKCFVFFPSAGRWAADWNKGSICILMKTRFCCPTGILWPVRICPSLICIQKVTLALATQQGLGSQLKSQWEQYTRKQSALSDTHT